MQVNPTSLPSVIGFLSRCDAIVAAIDERALVRKARLQERLFVSANFSGVRMSFVAEPVSLQFVADKLREVLLHANDEGVIEHASSLRKEFMNLYDLYVHWVKHARNRKFYLWALNEKTPYGDLGEDMKREIAGFIG